MSKGAPSNLGRAPRWTDRTPFETRSAGDHPKPRHVHFFLLLLLVKNATFFFGERTRVFYAPCLSIFSNAKEEMYTCSAVSTIGASEGGPPSPPAPTLLKSL